MIIYESTKAHFIGDVVNETLIDRLYNSYQQKIGRTSKSEIRSWENSLQRMSNVMQDDEIPNDAAVAIEFNIPNTSKRVDFLVAGNDGKHDHVVIVELKQWEEVEKIDTRDALVRTYLGRGMRETTHPSYQAWTYAALIEDFNESVQENEIKLKPCAYLHNYRKTEDDPLTDDHYQIHLEKAPVFAKGEIQKIRTFIKKYIRKGDERQLIYQIENGRIRPSKSLQDALKKMLHGNEEFLMIDDQKVFYEEAFHQALNAVRNDEKKVMIVQGGPGTGKSVLAINLLVNLINKELVTMYVTRNSAPRNVYSTKLKGDFKKSHIDNLFKGSGSFTEVEENEFDVLIVDEAHRLNEKSGLFYKGENQVKEIIKGANFTIFFIDEDQKVTLKDIGSVDLIKHFADEFNAEVLTYQLTSQFRCDGSDGYIAWLDDVLQIRETANMHELGMDYDFRIYEDPNQMLTKIEQLNRKNNKSRIMAGYCWEWPKPNRQDVNHHDIQIEEHNFGISWNIENTWAIENSSVREAGCIHTAQGLEFDYIGVIIGDDLRFENGQIITDHTKRAQSDQSLRGIKKLAKEEGEEKARLIADPIIKNTYRTLMTRGQKGCFVYCTNSALQQYFKERLDKVMLYKTKREKLLYLIDDQENYGDSLN